MTSTIIQKNIYLGLKDVGTEESAIAYKTPPRNVKRTIPTKPRKKKLSEEERLKRWQYGNYLYNQTRIGKLFEEANNPIALQDAIQQELDLEDRQDAYERSFCEFD